MSSSELTPRQREYLSLVAQGLTNREIADRLWVTEQAVKDMLRRLYPIIGVKSRYEVIERYREAA
jgi:DNA-binding CsgD family transcriptional regulator